MVSNPRTARISRQTRETDINVIINLDGSGKYVLNTGIGFFDHMFTQIARHSLIDLEIRAIGDLEVDMHHTIEDCGIVLGKALNQAWGDCKGINRYGMAICPMDESLIRSVIDISGRGHLVWKVHFQTDQIYNIDCQLFIEFFKSLAYTAGITLHIEALYGENSHHIIEGCFKAFARSLRQAIMLDNYNIDSIPSSKGIL